MTRVLFTHFLLSFYGFINAHFFVIFSGNSGYHNSYHDHSNDDNFDHNNINYDDIYNNYRDQHKYQVSLD